MPATRPHAADEELTAGAQKYRKMSRAAAAGDPAARAWMERKSYESGSKLKQKTKYKQKADDGDIKAMDWLRKRNLCPGSWERWSRTRRGAANPADTETPAQPTLEKRKRPSKYIHDGDFGGDSDDQYHPPESESDEDDDEDDEDDEESGGPATASTKDVKQNKNKTKPPAKCPPKKTAPQRKVHVLYRMVHGEYRAEERDGTPDLEAKLRLQNFALRRGELNEEELQFRLDYIRARRWQVA